MRGFPSLRSGLRRGASLPAGGPREGEAGGQIPPSPVSQKQTSPATCGDATREAQVWPFAKVEQLQVGASPFIPPSRPGPLSNVCQPGECTRPRRGVRVQEEAL